MRALALLGILALTPAVPHLLEPVAHAAKYSKKATKDLIEAAKLGRAEGVADALASGADPNAELDGNYVLEMACTDGNLEMAWALLMGGAKPTSKSLAGAVKHTDDALADRMIADGADPLDPIVMHGAAAGGDGLIIAKLMLQGADVNAKIRKGEVPLHAAARAGQLDAVRMLLGAGGDANAKGPRGTPEDAAREGGHAEVMTLIKEWKRNAELLWNAAGSNDLDEVTRLLDEGVDPSARHGGLGPHDPLAFASEKGLVAMVTLLLARGADPNSRSELGHTALIRACTRGRAEVVQLLLTHGADANWDSPVQGTAYDAARKNGYDEILVLIDNHLEALANEKAAAEATPEDAALAEPTEPAPDETAPSEPEQ